MAVTISKEQLRAWFQTYLPRGNGEVAGQHRDHQPKRDNVINMVYTIIVLDPIWPDDEHAIGLFTPSYHPDADSIGGWVEDDTTVEQPSSFSYRMFTIDELSNYITIVECIIEEEYLRVYGCWEQIVSRCHMIMTNAVGGIRTLLADEKLDDCPLSVYLDVLLLFADYRLPPVADVHRSVYFFSEEDAIQFGVWHASNH